VFVREALEQDAQPAAEVLAAVAEEGLISTEPPVDVDARADRFRGMLEPGRPDRLWVLCDEDGAIVGTLGLHATRVAGVLSLGTAIRDGYRGAGGGRMLMESALAWARDSDDVHKVELEVWPDNTRAIAYYRAFGFEEEGLRRDHYRRRDGSLRSAALMAVIVA
jgi:RimJ/RimL family protein N-acetyltransferase